MEDGSLFLPFSWMPHWDQATQQTAVEHPTLHTPPPASSPGDSGGVLHHGSPAHPPTAWPSAWVCSQTCAWACRGRHFPPAPVPPLGSCKYPPTFKSQAWFSKCFHSAGHPSLHTCCLLPAVSQPRAWETFACRGRPRGPAPSRLSLPQPCLFKVQALCGSCKPRLVEDSSPHPTSGCRVCWGFLSRVLSLSGSPWTASCRTFELTPCFLEFLVTPLPTSRQILHWQSSVSSPCPFPVGFVLTARYALDFEASCLRF